MTPTRVLVVDDSSTMRAMISGALERIPNVEIVGLANGADEARRLTTALRPDVMTLDVEMPGTSGMEYLAEIMATRPMPVIMFSSRTAAGAEASIEALRLGAIDCLPKPRAASAAELDKIIANLAKRIQAAKGSSPVPQDAAAAAPFDWNGRVITIGGDASNTKALFELLGTFPANCPPTLIVQHLSAELADAMVRKLDEKISPHVVMAAEGMSVEQGTIYFAPPGALHLALEGWPQGRVRMLPRDPVAGERPSISLMFVSIARAAPGAAVALLLAHGGEDGHEGAEALLATGSHCIAPAGRDFTLSRKSLSQPVAGHDLARTVLKLCSV